jgi:cytoskeletal protein CcmA (bactofilin family)
MLLKIGELAMKKGDEINAFLGKNTDFEGKLSFKGAVRVDGYFRGEIHSEGTLIVGESAVLESDVYVSRIVVSGEVRGNIVATERIEVHAPGKVFGNIQAPTVVIDEGVSFEGHCRMHQKGESDDRKLAVLRENWAKNKES